MIVRMDVNQIEAEPLDEADNLIEMHIAIVELDNATRDMRFEVDQIVQDAVLVSLDVDLKERRPPVHPRNDIRKPDEAAADIKADEFLDVLVVSAEEILEINIPSIVMHCPVQLAEVRECPDGFPPEMLKAD